MDVTTVAAWTGAVTGIGNLILQNPIEHLFAKRREAESEADRRKHALYREISGYVERVRSFNMHTPFTDRLGDRWHPLPIAVIEAGDKLDTLGLRVENEDLRSLVLGLSRDLILLVHDWRAVRECQMDPTRPKTAWEPYAEEIIATRRNIFGKCDAILHKMSVFGNLH